MLVYGGEAIRRRQAPRCKDRTTNDGFLVNLRKRCCIASGCWWSISRSRAGSECSGQRECHDLFARNREHGVTNVIRENFIFLNGNAATDLEQNLCCCPTRVGDKTTTTSTQANKYQFLANV